jgi:hypothetical protein
MIWWLIKMQSGTRRSWETNLQFDFYGQLIWELIRISFMAIAQVYNALLLGWINPRNNVKGSQFNWACQPSEWTALIVCSFPFSFFYIIFEKEEKKGENQDRRSINEPERRRKEEWSDWLQKLAEKWTTRLPRWKVQQPPKRQGPLTQYGRDISINELRTVSNVKDSRIYFIRAYWFIPQAEIE